MIVAIVLQSKKRKPPVNPDAEPETIGLGGLISKAINALVSLYVSSSLVCDFVLPPYVYILCYYL